MGDFMEILMKTVLFVVLHILFLVWPFQLCWNEFLVPAITGVHEIGLLQAMGILTICHVATGFTSLTLKK